MDRSIGNPNWNFRELAEDDTEYGGVTKYVIEHTAEPLSVRIAQSEGGHIMKCERGKWQVNLPEKSFNDHNNSVHCFETKEGAIDFAVTWVESRPE